MFGFGRSAQEKAAINSFAQQLQSIGLPERAALDSATKLVDEVLADLRPNGIDPFKTTQGDEQVVKQPFITPRLEAGLTIDDVRTHWNRPLLIVFAEVKLRELFNFLIVDIARQQGRDIVAAGNHYKRTFPRYGDPRKWDPMDKYNQGLAEQDADIFPEFAGRVDAWQRKVGESYVAEAITRHGTLNAAVRAEISSKRL